MVYAWMKQAYGLCICERVQGFHSCMVYSVGNLPFPRSWTFSTISTGAKAAQSGPLHGILRATCCHASTQILVEYGWDLIEICWSETIFHRPQSTFRKRARTVSSSSRVQTALFQQHSIQSRRHYRGLRVDVRSFRPSEQWGPGTMLC